MESRSRHDGAERSSAAVISLAAHRSSRSPPKGPAADPGSAWYHAAAVAEPGASLAGQREPAARPAAVHVLSTPLYVAYALDPEGTALSVRELDARTDASACAMAAIIPSLHGIEIWDCSRFVRRLPGTARF